MRDFPCPICNCECNKELYRNTLGKELPQFGYAFTPDHSKTYRIVLCENCKHAYSSPRPRDLWKGYECLSDIAYLQAQEDRLFTAQKVVNRLKVYARRGRLLDVGCGTGDFLFVAAKAYQVEGLELSRWAAEIARSRGFVVHGCEIGNVKAEESYDLITLWGVIEHFEYPSREVANMWRLLARGGLVCLWTGDVEALPSRFLGRKWWYIQGQHIQLFSRRSLGKLFESNGFEEVWIGRYPYMMTMRSIANSLRRYRLLGSASKFLLDRPFLGDRRITLALPGEMFAIFRKTDNAAIASLNG